MDYSQEILNELGDNTDYEKSWPSAILKKHNGHTDIKEERDFTLGDCRYLFGIKGSSISAENNKYFFVKYCKESLLMIKDENEITKKLKEYDKIIQKVKNFFRNPASHKKQISLKLAQECINYIIDLEKALIVKVDVSNFRNFFASL